ncbi:MAG: 2-oxoglutarate ferredoxin oxidoreductase subunit beta [Betaproteobacteria bacterium]|nr:2-oxoglutarate ferredoxin oxidoreductase subunit beta [Betaproteobacteria bacterium]
MKLQNSFILREYLRPQAFPTTWCPGCGLGIVMSSIAQAVHFRGLDKNNVAMVSGIGCTGRMSGYADFNTLHTTHGRAPAFATGLKMARPDMSVIVVMGDGDSMSIGGNHLVHAMRRNIGLTAVVVNNAVYGLTGGQSSPTTPVGGRTSTAASGSFERPMNLETLARAAGAAFYARATVNQTAALTRLIERAMGVSGFALVEVVSNCHVLYGRMNELGDASQMMKSMEEQTRRVNPVLLRRAAAPLRLTSAGSPATPVSTATAQGVHQDPRVPRGVIFERHGSRDYSSRYYAMLEQKARARA